VAPRAALGVDLALRSWRANGAALLTFTTGATAAWQSCRTHAIAWPTTALTPETMAEAIDAGARAHGVGAVALDGPHAWRDPNPAAHLGPGRRCEYEARTPGKTGAHGIVYPRGYARWAAFSIAVFACLLARPHIHLTNDPDTDRLAPPPGHYFVLETFPTATWRASGLVPLPGHRRAPPPIVAEYAAILRAAYALPPTASTDEHDELQAIVAALPAAALLGGPGRAMAAGEPVRPQPGNDATPPHLIEGLLWSCRPTSP
jgi:hypothetical protein